MTERRDSMPYNYSKLLGRIKEYGYTQESLAKAIDKDKSTISLKLNGKGEFKAGEIDSICRVLDIPNDKIGEYFFAV
jgi:transcriptional regulator with XRE-family HTH domain